VAPNLYPRRLDSAIPTPRSEQRVHEAASTLSDRWFGYHSLHLHSQGAGGEGRDGEIDFVFAHPDHGILIVEVKGGGLGYDAESGWYSIDRREVRHGIQDPFRQAERNKYALRDLLAGHLRRSVPWLMGHAVVVTDMRREEVPARPNAPESLIVDCDDLDDLERRLRQVLDHWRGEQPRFEPPGAAGMQALEDVLARSSEIKTTLGFAVRDSEQQIVRLTEMQYRLLTHLQRQKRVAIAGCAGAGKTMLAMEKARRLAARGQQVLVTCFNVGLGNDLEARAASLEVNGPGSVRAAHYHRLARELAVEAGLDVPDHGDTHSDGDYYRQTLPEAMVEAATILGPRWDAIIVDEAQDFLEEYWTSLLLHHRDPDHGILYAFFDDNQKLYTDDVYLPPDLGEPVLLPENCRNTQTIFEVVRSFYESSHELDSANREGRPVERIPAESERDIVDACRKTLHRLVNESKIPPSDIAILTIRRAEDSVLARQERLGNFELSLDLATDADAVLLASIHKFKGLEKPVIVLVLSEPDYQSRAPWDELMYVGTSRARSHLVLIGDEQTLAAIPGGAQ
jgi:hypothetical protein